MEFFDFYLTTHSTVDRLREPNEYSELVIDFGNGIVMDYNNNLCVDVKKSATATDHSTLQVKGFWRDATFKKETPDRVAMEGYFAVERNGASAAEYTVSASEP